MKIQKILYVFLLIFSVVTFAQTSTPEVVIDIPAEIAKYYIEDFNFIGPSCIDIDKNGDMYIGGGRQILVFDKTGKHLRSMMFFRGFTETIRDIAVGADDKLYVLASSKAVYIIPKEIKKTPRKKEPPKVSRRIPPGRDTGKVAGKPRVHIINTFKENADLYPLDSKLVDIGRDKILKFIYLRSGSAFRRIWVTEDNRCLVGNTEDTYYILDDAELIYNEVNATQRVYPAYSAILKNRYYGMPIKWRNSVIQARFQRTGTLDLVMSDVGNPSDIIPSRKSYQKQMEIVQTAPDKSTFTLFDLMPESDQKRYKLFIAKEIVGVNYRDQMFIRTVAIPTPEFGRKKADGLTVLSDSLFLVISKSSQYVNKLSSIPADKVSTTFSKGKRFNIGADGRLYHVYTYGYDNLKGEENLKTCRTHIIRW